MQAQSFSQWRIGGFLAVVTWIGCGLAAQTASTQEPDDEYLEIREIDGKPIVAAEAAKFRSEALRLARTGRLETAEEQRQFDEYMKYRIYEFTWKENRAELQDKRAQLKRDYLFRADQASAPDLHNRLNTMLLTEMPKIADNDKVHPGVRANCMLVVADLNRTEPRPGGPDAVPLPEALPVLVKAARDADQHVAVRVTALRGIIRHANARQPAGARQELTQAMLGILTAPRPQEGSRNDGTIWVRMLAAEVLAGLAAQGPEANTPEVSMALVEMAADQSIPVWVRCHVAESLAAMNPKNIDPAAMESVATDMAGLVVDIVVDVLAKANGLAQGDSEPSKPSPKLRELAGAALSAQLSRVKTLLLGSGQPAGAAGGLRGAATEDSTRSLIDETVKRIDELMTMSVDTKVSLADLSKSAQEKGRELEALIDSQAESGPSEPVAVETTTRQPGAQGATVNVNP